MPPLALLSSDAGAIAVGAVIGALSRYQAGQTAAQWIAKDPTKRATFQGWHTAGINVAGSFVLGSLAGTPVKMPTSATATTMGSGLSPRTKLLMGVGFCGSFTTFSTFSVDVATWVSQGQLGKAAGYILTNNIGGFVAATAGMLIMKKIFG
jgi:fluoride exporter